MLHAPVQDKDPVQEHVASGLMIVGVKLVLDQPSTVDHMVAVSVWSYKDIYMKLQFLSCAQEVKVRAWWVFQGSAERTRDNVRRSEEAERTGSEG